MPETAEPHKRPDSTLAHRLIQSARRNWFRLAITDTSSGLTFGRVLAAAIIVRNWLAAKHHAERNIGLMLPTSPAGAIANFGVTLAGKTVVNLNFTAGEENCRAAVEQCEIRTVITSRAFLEKAALEQWPEIVFIEDILSAAGRGRKILALLAARFAPIKSIVGPIAPDDIAAIIFSSGTTGVPKGIELTHWNIVSNVDALSALFPVTRRDCMLGVLPLFHSFGYTFALWFPALTGFRSAFHSNPTDAKTIGDLARAQQATFFLSTPTLCSQYARKCLREQFQSLKYIIVGAEKLRDAVAEEFRNKFGISLIAGYGCTELGPGVAVNTPDAARAGSVGRPLAGVSIRIVHPETFEPLPAGQQGMVLVNGPSRMRGYHEAPEKTAAVLHDGYYETGDLGYLDEEGFLYITDRVSRFSKIAGEMVPHLRIEEALSAVLVNAPCFVTGVPDERRGERLCVLYTAPEVTPAQMIEHLNKSGLPSLWIPKRDNFYLVDAIPMLGSGKVDIGKARTMAALSMRRQMLTRA